MTQEKTTTQSASQRKIKHVKVSDLEHTKINDTVRVLASLFYKRANALGIKICKRGKNRNVPGQTDAVKCLLLPTFESGYDGMSRENLAYWYVEDMLKQMGAV
jgi:hypothetical protein